MTNAPRLSVVVTTHNRAHLLPRLIRCLEAQEAPAAMEVIVVDDASTDDTPNVLTNLEASSSLNLRWLRRDRQGGPGAGRNTGWRAATGDIIAFTDDDCQPQPGWIAAILEGMSDPDVGMVQGRTEPDITNAEVDSWFDHRIDIDGPSPWFETCNLAYRRDLLERLDGFDERFERWGEDTDLGVRAVRRGARRVYAPEARVSHDVVPQTWSDAARERRRRAGTVPLVAQHPELREHFTYPFAYDKVHVTTVGMLAATAVAALRPRWITPWLLLGWLARRYLGERPKQIHGPPHQRVGRFFAWLGLDLAETAYFARASIRHRSLLL